jgi:hypothetical protein
MRIWWFEDTPQAPAVAALYESRSGPSAIIDRRYRIRIEDKFPDRLDWSRWNPSDPLRSHSPVPVSRLKLLAALASGLLVLTANLDAAGGFTSTLSTDQQATAGLTALAPAERAALDRLVAAELAVVRQGELRDLAGTFVSRRSEAEQKSAGLDRLTPAELAKLDELVAAALAARPKPKERPRLKDDDVIGAARKPEIHGAVSFAYGWGGGGTFRASSLWVDYFDPASGLGVGIGLATISGDGFYGYYPDYYGSRYGVAAPVYFDASYRGGLRDDYAYGTGESLRGPSGWNSFGHGRRGR